MSTIACRAAGLVFKVWWARFNVSTVTSGFSSNRSAAVFAAASRPRCISPARARGTGVRRLRTTRFFFTRRFFATRFFLLAMLQTVPATPFLDQRPLGRYGPAMKSHGILVFLALFVFSLPAKAFNPEVIHTVLVGLPGVQDEGHLEDVALGIAHASDNLTTGENPRWPWARSELVAALVMMGFMESRFIRRIGEGRCHKWECDATKLRDGRVVHRARGFYQMQRTSYSSPFWSDLIGVEYDQQVASAQVAGTILAANRARCKSRSGMISAYATGIGCSWSKAAARTHFMLRVLDRLKAAEAAQLEAA